MASATLRTATLADRAAIEALKQRCGLGGDKTEADWRHLYDANPAMRRLGVELPIGWVLEVGDQIVGNFGSIPMLFHSGRRTVPVAASNSYAVDPEHRGHSIKVLTPFMKQGGVEMVMVTTAGDITSKLCHQLFKAEALPQPDYFQALFWALRTGPVAREYLKKRALRGPTLIAARFLLPTLLRCEGLVRGRRPGAPAAGLTVERCAPEQIGPEFDELWQRRTLDETPFMAERSAEVLRWRFGLPRNRERTRIIVCRRGGHLVGYGVVERTGRVPDLVRGNLSDLLAEGDDPAVIGAILRGAHDHARADGCDILEVVGLPPRVRRALHTARPYTRQIVTGGIGSYIYRCREPALSEVLRAPEAWYACSSDGDTGL